MVSGSRVGHEARWEPRWHASPINECGGIAAQIATQSEIRGLLQRLSHGERVALTCSSVDNGADFAERGWNACFLMQLGAHLVAFIRCADVLDLGQVTHEYRCFDATCAL